MTRGDLIFETSRALGLDDTAGVDELTLMQGWANRGVVDVLLRTHCFVDIGDMTLIVGTTDYRIDSNILAMLNMHVTSNSQRSSVEVMDMQDLDEYLNANIVNGPPSYAAIEGTLLRVAPAPASADVIRYYYIPKPSLMTADANDPSVATYGGIPSEFHEAVLYFMLWKGAEYDDKQASLSPKDYRQAYENLCGDYRKRHRQKAGRGLHAGRLGYPSRGLTGRRNDVYPQFTR